MEALHGKPKLGLLLVECLQAAMRLLAISKWRRHHSMLLTDTVFAYHIRLITLPGGLGIQRNRTIHNLMLTLLALLGSNIQEGS